MLLAFHEFGLARVKPFAHCAVMAKKWIQSAIRHPGALHKKLGIPKGQKIPAGKLAAAAKAGGTEGREARLAQTLGGLRHGKKSKMRR